MKTGSENGSSIKNRRLWLIIGGFVLLEIIILTYFTYRYGVQHIDSDDSAEMVLANLLNREGALISKNWYYSTELRVLNTQVIMAPLFSVFTSWNVVRTAGTFILLCILALSYLLFCRLSSIGKYAVWLSPVLLWPFSEIYHDFVLFGLYYIPHLAVAFVSLGLFLNIIQTKRYSGIKALLLGSVALLAGLGGVRILIVVYVPLIAACIIDFVFYGKKQLRDLIKTPSLLYSFFAFLMAATGYVINSRILSKIYSFSSWNQVEFTKINYARLGEIINDILRVMGYVPGRKAISLGGMINLLVLVSCATLIFFCISIIKRLKELDCESRILVGYCILTLAATVASGVLTNQSWWAARYLILPLINFVLIWSVYMKYFSFSLFRNQLLSACLVVTIVLAGVKEYRGWPVYNKNAPRQAALEYLQEEDYRFGYASWNNAEVLTEMTDGRIQTCKITNWKDFTVWYWLMDKDFMKYARDEKIFILIETKELTFDGSIGYINGSWKESELSYLTDQNKVYEDSEYRVYSYNSLAELERLRNN